MRRVAVFCVVVYVFVEKKTLNLSSTQHVSIKYILLLLCSFVAEEDLRRLKKTNNAANELTRGKNAQVAFSYRFWLLFVSSSFASSSQRYRIEID